MASSQWVRYLHLSTTRDISPGQTTPRGNCLLRKSALDQRQSIGKVTLHKVVTYSSGILGGGANNQKVGVLPIPILHVPLILKTQRWALRSNGKCFPFSGQNDSDPFISEKKLFGLYGLCYSIRPARHGLNAKISFEKYAPSPKILPKNCQKSAFQTRPSKFDTFWPICLASVHIFQNRAGRF